MPGIPLISSALSESWVAWTLLALLAMLPLASAFQPQLIRVSFASLLSSKERDSIFVASSPDFRARLILYLYTLLIQAMAMMVLFRTNGDFSYETFCVVLACTLGVSVVKWLLQRLVAYVFFTPQALEVFERHYNYLNHAAAVSLLPITLVAIYLPSVSISWLIGLYATDVILYIMLVIYKTIVLFARGAQSTLYITLYVLTLEVVPVGALVVVVNALI